MLIIKGRLEISGLSVGTYKADSVFARVDLRVLSLDTFVERKLAEIFELHMKMKVVKRAFIHEVLEKKEQCKFYLFGAKCSSECGICGIRGFADMARNDYNCRHKLGQEGKRALYRNVLRILTGQNVDAMVLAGVENLDQILLYVCLDQLRAATALHIRGCQLNTAIKLESLLTFYKACLDEVKLRDPTKFFESKDKQTSVFNDDNSGQIDCSRQHLVHCTIDFTSGFYLGSNMNWVKKGLDDTTEALNRAECVKRKVKLSVFNDENSIDFEPPMFDVEKKIFQSKLLLKSDANNMAKPLTPIKKNNKTFIF